MAHVLSLFGWLKRVKSSSSSSLTDTRTHIPIYSVSPTLLWCCHACALLCIICPIQTAHYCRCTLHTVGTAICHTVSLLILVWPLFSYKCTQQNLRVAHRYKQQVATCLTYFATTAACAYVGMDEEEAQLLGGPPPPTAAPTAIGTTKPSSDM